MNELYKAWDLKVQKIHFHHHLKYVNGEKCKLPSLWLDLNNTACGGYLICHAVFKLPEHTEQYIANKTIKDGLVLG